MFMLAAVALAGAGFASAVPADHSSARDDTATRTATDTITTTTASTATTMNDSVTVPDGTECDPVIAETQCGFPLAGPPPARPGTKQESQTRESPPNHHGRHPTTAATSDAPRPAEQGSCAAGYTLFEGVCYPRGVAGSG